ncbi:protein of unknown function [Hyphomicrobium sp. MC1]|nr:protein of unknown function [Hyphomicrobium sp. MC1]
MLADLGQLQVWFDLLPQPARRSFVYAQQLRQFPV